MSVLPRSPAVTISAPRVEEQADKPIPDLLLRETDITSERTLIDLSGAPITEAAFALRHHVRLVPVVRCLMRRCDRSASRWSVSTARVSTRPTLRRRSMHPASICGKLRSLLGRNVR
jgi:hypothetical protein